MILMFNLDGRQKQLFPVGWMSKIYNCFLFQLMLTKKQFAIQQGTRGWDGIPWLSSSVILFSLLESRRGLCVSVQSTLCPDYPEIDFCSQFFLLVLDQCAASWEASGRLLLGSLLPALSIECLTSFSEQKLLYPFSLFQWNGAGLLPIDLKKRRPLPGCKDRSIFSTSESSCIMFGD